jgi:hypothetical protein
MEDVSIADHSTSILVLCSIMQEYDNECITLYKNALYIQFFFFFKFQLVYLRASILDIKILNETTPYMDSWNVKPKNRPRVLLQFDNYIM